MQRVECKYWKITRVERNRHVWLFASFITEKKPCTFHWSEGLQILPSAKHILIASWVISHDRKKFPPQFRIFVSQNTKTLSRGKMLNPKLISEEKCRIEGRVSTHFHITLLEMWRTGHLETPSMNLVLSLGGLGAFQTTRKYNIWIRREETHQQFSWLLVQNESHMQSHAHSTRAYSADLPAPISTHTHHLLDKDAD